ncbi:hypothetical protein [Metabacillus indicus]|uniref:Uncharacterized protein n=1 Tax=Metabacillus indicus TaxID=246786 RepID=A0A084GIQ3_METID|nr:hypothetical protein [Metabacillus indicus]KEZ47215.1 hypothetical protein GS18_0220435 [Metabacillus indicus]KEZ49807.1 hypothetical protein AZ46_0203575 [Metabacillus indicus LMG 22858]
MDKTVTFSFASSNYVGIEATETFSLKELGIDGELNDENLKIEIDKLFQAWVWDKINISYSIVISD